VGAPTIRITQPADGSTFGSDETVTYRGVVTDPYDANLGDSASWSVDGVPVGTGADGFQYRIPTQGVHTVTLSATNSAGASASDSINVTIGPPTGKPSVKITKPPDGSGWASGQDIEFSATADTQGGATISSSGYSWSSDLDGFLGTGQTIHHSLSASGYHHITVTVTDSFGRSSSDTIIVSVGGFQ
jgi:hypothetical protein